MLKIFLFKQFTFLISLVFMWSLKYRSWSSRRKVSLQGDLPPKLHCGWICWIIFNTIFLWAKTQEILGGCPFNLPGAYNELANNSFQDNFG